MKKIELIKERWSPSTRRAWIEIIGCLAGVDAERVALHTEGVD